MKPNRTIFFNKADLYTSKDLSLKSRSNYTNGIFNSIDNTESNISQTLKSNPKKHNTNSQENKREKTCLKTGVIKKMLSKFLLEKKMKQEDLARVLCITPKELEKLLLDEKVGPGLVNKVNLPLIKFYCSTKWS